MTSRFRTAQGVVALLLLGLLAWGAIATVAPPPPAPGTASADSFSADRARVHQERISVKPHPTGSQAAADVRRYILDELRTIGIDARVQDAVGGSSAFRGTALARVQNIVAEMPGTDASGTLFLVAHYDSATVSHGAGDDGAGVSTLLETARALRAADALRNDVVFVFTDAEEACLCGAEAFMTQDAAAKNGGVVLNFESRGSSGPGVMFETTVGNADLVNLYGASVPSPVATSFAVEVYRLLPNDTDFSPFRDADRFTGLNTAYIDGSATYHQPQDDIEHQSTASLQHMGANALAMTRALGAADIAHLRQPSESDASYFPVLGQLVRYPGALVWPIAVIGLIGVGAAAVLVVRRGRTTWPRMLASVGLGVLPVLGALAVGLVIWRVLLLVSPSYGQFDDPWVPGWYRIAVVSLVFAVAITWLALFRRRFSGEALAVGGLFWLAVVGVVMAALTPGGSYLAAIPAIFGAVAMIVHLLTRWGVVAQLLSGAAAVVILAPTVALFFPAMGLRQAAPAALFTVFIALVLIPLLDTLFPAAQRPSRRVARAVPALASTLVAVIAIGIGLVVNRPSSFHPVPVEMQYALDADTGKAYWVRPGADPTGWSDALVDRAEDLSTSFAMLDADSTVGDAPSAQLAPADVRVVSERVEGGNRVLQLRIVSERGARVLHLTDVDGNVTGATARGREVPIEDGFAMLFHGLPAEGLDLTVTVRGTGKLRLRVEDATDGIDGLPGFAPRPEGVAAMGSHTAEMAIVARTILL